MTKSPYDEQADRAKAWLASLRPQPQDNGFTTGDRAAIARLKRATNVMEAAAEPATADLFKRLGFQRKYAARDLPRAAVIAAVLAHVTRSSGANLARAIGPTDAKDPSSALLKPLRLKRLLAAREPDDVLIQFRRTVAILDHTANVADLAQQLLAWTDDERGDLSRTIFAFHYHGAGDHAPTAQLAPV
jgi:CRISPR system Cascade subunit CasB